MAAIVVIVGMMALAAVGILLWPDHGANRLRGLGRLVVREETGRFDVGLIHHEQPLPDYPAERSLVLTVVGDGVYVEVSVGDGAELLAKLYEGRVWLFTPEIEREHESS